MSHSGNFYIGGKWVSPTNIRWFDVVNPATEEIVDRIALGDAHDVDHAVHAARSAFNSYAATRVSDRIELFERILQIYTRRYEEFAEVVRIEMGAPIAFSRSMQTARGTSHLKEMIRVLKTFPFQEKRGSTLLTMEPVGVCGLITPWNAPINQIVVKVAPALAAGCTVVLKPSEYSPLSALMFAEVLDEAGVPPGVFNLINGEGAEVGAAISAHPDIDMVSFTGSTRAGVLVAKAAADTVKRVAQELGGKSANILLDDVDLKDAVSKGVAACFANAGQSCSSPTRMLVPEAMMRDATRFAKEAAEAIRIGPTEDEKTTLGPLVNRTQFNRAQRLIQAGIDEGASLVTGGVGLPPNAARGFFVKPTVFTDVDPAMTIATEEIFGPVLSLIPYRTEADAISIANESKYGLAAYVQSKDHERARRVARELRAGCVYLNYPPLDFGAPFGGFKQSGNGREWSEFGLREYLEFKSVIGYDI